ncbi:MAG TPA: hypothetical protein VJ281_00675 [Chthoniobacterales bacterium]|jgi:hypothetical protein|nr:hypothetical protein [Chthoniobacterales bacterium]
MKWNHFNFRTRAILVALTVGTVPLNVFSAALVFDSSGNLFFEARNSDEIVKFAADGTKTIFAKGTPDAPINGEIAIDAAGNIYASANFTTILKYAPDGSKVVFATNVGKTWANALIVDPAGNLFVSTSAGILKFAPDGSKSAFATGVEAYAFAFDQAGNLFACDSHGENGKLVSAIVKFAPDGTKSTFSKDSGYGLAFDKPGNLFVAGVDSVLKFTPDGKKSTFANVGGAESLAFDPAGNLVACDGNNNLFKLAADGTRSVFKWRTEPGGEEEQGEDSADALPPKYAKDYLVAQKTLSPDKKFAVIYPTSDEEDVPGAANYLVSLKPFAILTKLQTKRPYFKNESNSQLTAEWSDDGSVALVTLDAKWGPGDVFLLEVKDGKLARSTNILAKAHDLLLPEFRKSKAGRYNDYYDFIFETEESSGFELDGSKAVRVNASATTDPKGSDEGKVWDGHVQAVWDIPQGKFISQKVATEFAGKREHSE